MTKVLITGATGFVGSALTASLLAEGGRVVALSRSDPTGVRTRAAVEKAAEGFGLALSPEQWRGLSVVEVDFRDLERTLEPGVFEGVTDVWNVAAEMAYSIRKILEAVDQNVVATSVLYRLTERHARDCRRFYHVSTAYTAGIGAEEAREVINFTPKLVNSYQLSKWMAEVALLQQQKERGLPLTILRPSIIIGHERSGWSSGASFGMFLLAEAVLYGKQEGAEHLLLDLEPEAQPNLVCIDTVIRRVLALMKAESPSRQPAEIFNCIGDECVRTADVVEQLERVIGVRVSFGAPVNKTDARINAAFERNRPFANARWNFHADHLKQVLGEAYGPAGMSQELIGRSVTYYVARRIAEAKAEESSHAA
jgi:nucleoside-diphosphate-sugar epimerase